MPVSKLKISPCSIALRVHWIDGKISYGVGYQEEEALKNAGVTAEVKNRVTRYKIVKNVPLIVRNIIFTDKYGNRFTFDYRTATGRRLINAVGLQEKSINDGSARHRLIKESIMNVQVECNYRMYRSTTILLNEVRR